MNGRFYFDFTLIKKNNHTMKALAYLLILSVATCSLASAQSYSGKFKHKKALTEFEHFVVAQDHKNGIQGAVVSVRAFDGEGNMWESKAEHAKPHMISEVMNNFKNDKDIVSVYKLHFKHGRDKMDYYMIGYRDQNDKERFILLEELHHGPEDVVPVEINTFVWASSTTLK